MDSRRYSADLLQGGLEIPCKLIFRGDKEEIAKVKKLTVPIKIDKKVKQESYQGSKKQKLSVPEVIDADTVVVAGNHVEPKQWLSFNNNGIALTELDKNLILQGERLNDKHINFAQRILKTILQICLVFNLHCYLLNLSDYLMRICTYKFYMTGTVIGLLCQQLEINYQKHTYMIPCIHLLTSIQNN